ncbi:MAG: rhodanese-like domain-containing protein [Gammaproteobacteria bacterium]|nr:rhodanese-like domain-containing protein [Gammaproteobacteria bacterium]
MKTLTVVLMFLSLCTAALADEALADEALATDRGLEQYITNFDYAARKDMKMDSQGLIQLLKEGNAQLIDIRFPEEFAAWKVSPATNIPLPELPARLDELDTSKVIVTACPHTPRAVIAMLYLRSRGIPAKFLKDGLIGLADNLRGDDARDFIQQLPK